MSAGYAQALTVRRVIGPFNPAVSRRTRPGARPPARWPRGPVGDQVMEAVVHEAPMAGCSLFAPHYAVVFRSGRAGPLFGETCRRTSSSGPWQDFRDAWPCHRVPVTLRHGWRRRSRAMRIHGTVARWLSSLVDIGRGGPWRRSPGAAPLRSACPPPTVAAGTPGRDRPVTLHLRVAAIADAVKPGRVHVPPTAAGGAAIADWRERAVTMMPSA